MFIPTHPGSPALGAHSHTTAVRRSSANLPIGFINLPRSASFPYLVAPVLASLTPPPGAVGSLEIPAPGGAVNNTSTAPDVTCAVDDTTPSAARRSDWARVADVMLTSPLSVKGHATTSPVLKAAESMPTLVSDVGDGAAHALAGGSGAGLRNPAEEVRTRGSHTPFGQVIGPFVVLFGKLAPL